MDQPTEVYSFDLPTTGVIIDGRYEVIDRIGEGSYGWVFAIKHRLLDQTFAMKLLHPRIATDPSWIARFREEAKSTSLIGHENIVFVTDFGKCPDYGYYFVMEHLAGDTLKAVLTRQEQLEVQRALRITLQIAGALSAAHDLGIVHRDLKPGNIMLVTRNDGTETSKVLDFGISSVVMAAHESQDLYGTPAYMAPEQAVEQHVDHRADQFSLATILYQMLTGRRPWRTTQWADATAKGRAEPPRPPSALRAELPGELDEVILRALSLDCERRWPDVDTFAAHLASAVTVDWIPRFDPIDMYWEETEVDEVRPAVSVHEPRAGESMVIVLGEDDEDEDAFELASRSLVTVRFSTADRLYREYRRNLMAGGLFLPTEERPELNSEIDLCIVFEPGACSVELRAEVVTHSAAGEEGASGFGVAVANADRAKLADFLRRLELGLELSQADTLHPAGRILADESLSAAEAFIHSRIDEPMSVAQVRSFASGLPFEVDQALRSLIEKGYLRYEMADLSAASQVSSVYEDEEALAATEAPTEARRRGEHAPAVLLDDEMRPPWSDEADNLAESSEISYSRKEVARVLGMARYLKARQNYLGAIQVLRKALEVSPSVAEFYHQLALLHANFRGDFARAFQAMHGAIQLEPQNPEFQRTRAQLERMVGHAD